MYYDVVSLKKFYESNLGQSVSLAIGKVLKKDYNCRAGDKALGLGYAIPWIPSLSVKASSFISLMPAFQGAIIWPSGAKNKTALVSETALPLPEASMDYVFAIHLLEHVYDEFEVLQELWRVLKPCGRLILVVPKKSYLLFNKEKTPFTNAKTYRLNQIQKYLNYKNFLCKKYHEIAYLGDPPKWISTNVIQKIRFFLPLVQKILIIEAQKNLYRPVFSYSNKKKRKILFIPQNANKVYKSF